MPFNKGDFTQQGVNGHVNATVRLNEKRLVNIDMTSNEEAEGCTIAGTVTDLLNDKVYNIGSGGGRLATVEFEENGTYLPSDYEAYGFGEVTVNVAGGGGDSNFTTVQVTIISDTIVRALEGFKVYDQGGMSGIAVYDTLDVGTYIRTVPLYKGLSVWFIPAQYTEKITVSGDIDMQDGVLLITGDGTITFTS